MAIYPPTKTTLYQLGVYCFPHIPYTETQMSITKDFTHDLRSLHKRIEKVYQNKL